MGALARLYVSVNDLDSRFERELARRLRSELDALPVRAPAASPAARRLRPLAFVSAVALAVGGVLAVGSVAAVASGSPNPRVWVHQAEQTLGLAPADATPGELIERAGPSPEASESPASAASPEGEAPASPGGERESPEPSRSQPEPSEPVERSSPGDG